jgi:alkanesulfonate monooxygenase SsuD/methylene tetrahydromethanopterin reductase-like flavin-dependent oxidoreductase (luciferase family)
MNLGMAIADFTQPQGPAGIAHHVGRFARAAEEYGFTRIAVMDHLFQIGIVGTSEQEMLEVYTTLRYLAASTERVELLALVTSAGYREPGLPAKMVTTLDVLSESRAALGIGVGAGFDVAEARGLGLPFPPVAERFERTLNSPGTVRRPHPPMAFDAFTHVESISPRPLLIAGSRADTLYFSREAIEKANEPKELFVIDGATHIDMYDRPQFVPQAITELTDFYAKYL